LIPLSGDQPYAAMAGPINDSRTFFTQNLTDR
jgi:hypothetical protein